ncbi:MAG: helix-turn-helix transcriptional regulator [Bauldia sp.]
MAELELLLLQLFDLASVSDWETWLGTVKKTFAAAAATIAPLGLPSWREGVVVGVSEERRAAYRDHYHRLDLWTQRMRTTPEAVPHTLQMLVPERELQQSEFYNDFMKPAGRRYVAGTTVDIAGSRFLLAFSRSRSEPDFDAEDLRRIERLGAFLKRALTTQRMIHLSEVESDASHQVLNQSRRAILLLDNAHRVVFANETAAIMLSAEDILGVRGSQVTALNRGDERRFRETVESAVAVPGEQKIMVLHGTRSDEQVTASVVGIAAPPASPLDFGIVRPTTLMIITQRSERTEVAPEFLETVFGFTAKEAQVASLLVSGLELGEVALALSISRETVRHHLKSLFSKTHTHSQRELVHLITMSLPTSALNSVRANGNGSAS